MRFPSATMFESERDKKIRFARPQDLSVRQLLCKTGKPKKHLRRKWRQMIFWVLAFMIIFWWVDKTVTPDHSVISELIQ